MGKSVYSSFKVNPTQHVPKNALFVCLFTARNLMRKISVGRKLYRISQGEDCVKAKRKEKSILSALWRISKAFLISPERICSMYFQVISRPECLMPFTY